MLNQRFRKVVRALLSLLLLPPVFAWAQSPAPPITTPQISMPLFGQNILPVSSSAVQIMGNPGGNTFYYWFVANYTVGSSAVAGPFIANQAPTTLSGSNYVQLRPVIPAGAASVDTLRTTSPTPPSGACNCAVATGSSSTPINDQSNSLGSYTVATFDPNTITLYLQNEAQSAGVSHLILRQGPTAAFVADLSTGGGGGGSGTVTSIGFEVNGLSASGAMTVLGSPVTTAGVINLTWTGVNGDVIAFSPANSPSDSGVLLSSLALLASPTFTGTVTIPALTLSGITGVAAQCLHVDTSGILSGTGSDCGSSGGSGTVTSVGLTVNGGASAGALAVSGSPVTTSGAFNLAWTGVNGDVMTFGASNAPTDSGTLLSSLAPLASPALTGNPTAPTQTAGNSSTRLANTLFVATSFAPIASPTFTGTVTMPGPTFNNITGLTQCLHVNSSGTVSGTGSDCGSGGGGGSVTSVGLTVNGSSSAGALAVSGSPVTTAGAFNLAWTGVNGDIMTFGASNAPTDSGTLLSSLAPKASPTFTGTVTIPALTLSAITGSAQCLHVNSSGVVSGAGADCKTGTVTSVAVTINGGSSSGAQAVTGSPITAAGTFNFAWTGVSGDLLTFGGSNSVTDSGTLLSSLAPKNNPTLSGTVTMPAPTLNNVTGSVQCLHVNSSGVVSGTGVNCGSSSGSVTSVGLTVNGGASSGALAVSGSPVTTSGAFNLAWTGVNGDVMTFGASNAPTDSGTLLSSLAPLASPALTGNPTAPTQTAGNSSTRLANTLFVATSFAPLASPTFTGTVTLPITGSTQCLHVSTGGVVSGTGSDCGAGGGGVSSVGLTVNGGASSGAMAITGSPVTTSGTFNFAWTGTSGDLLTFGGSNSVTDSGTLLSSLAPKASPTFTGTVTIPALTLSSITGSTQCLQANTSGVVSGAACKAGTVTSVGATVNGGSSSGALAITGSPVTAAGTFNFAWTGTNGDVMTFGAGNAPTDSGTLLSSLAPKASPTFTGTVTTPNLTVTSLAQDAIAYGGAGGAITGLGSPTTNGAYDVIYNVTGSAAVAPTAVLPGVTINAQTGSSYTYLYSDRLTLVTFANAGAVAASLPAANSTGFTNNWAGLSCNSGAGTVTVTPATSTVSFWTGSAYTAGASSIALTTGQCAWIYSDNSNYFAIRR